MWKFSRKAESMVFMDILGSRKSVDYSKIRKLLEGLRNRSLYLPLK